MLAIISDRKLQVADAGLSLGHYFTADIHLVQDYYPYGMTMPGRTVPLTDSDTEYRYGFQGQEEDGEMYGGAVSYKYRVHDPRLGRFLSLDPLAPEYPFYSPYAFSGNRVIDMVELEGLEPKESYIYQLGWNGPVIHLLTYDLMKDDGPTQVAQKMTEIYGEEYDWFDVTTLNPEYFDHIPAEERLNKFSEFYANNPTPPGTNLIMGIKIMDDSGSGEYRVVPADKTFIDKLKERDKEIDRMNRHAFEENTREATEFEKLLRRSGMTSREIFNAWNLGQSLLLPWQDGNPLQPPIFNTVSGLPLPAGKEGLRLTVALPETTKFRNMVTVDSFHHFRQDNGIRGTRSFKSKKSGLIIRHPDGKKDTIFDQNSSNQ